MKLLTLAIAAVVAATATAEDACSPEQVTALKTSAAYKTLQMTDCSYMLRTKCNESACLNSIVAVIKVMPNCTIDGVALKQGVTNQLARIKSSCVEGYVTVTKTPLTPAKDGCTAEQVVLADNNKYGLARRQACNASSATDSVSSAHKYCDKACQDAGAALVAAIPNCTVNGLNVREEFVYADADLRSSCKMLAEAEATTAPTPTTRKITTSAPVSVSVSAAASASSVVGIAVAAVAALMRL